MEEKMYTYEFTYYDPDAINKESATQFCAQTADEAVDLFSDFLQENYPGVEIEPLSMAIVYNEYDDIEYSPDYGPKPYDEPIYLDTDEYFS